MSEPTLTSRVPPHSEQTHRAPFDLPIAALALEETGKAEPWHRLVGNLTIGGCPFHVLAIAIGSGCNAEAPELRDTLMDFYRAARVAEGPFAFNMVSIADGDGREHRYAIFIVPEDLIIG